MEEQRQARPHIVPTVGRVVWYWPGDADGEMEHDGIQPLRADICFVNDDGTVNLSINDCEGDAFKRHDVRLLQGDHVGTSLRRPFATWMPYQKSQASKAEANEKAPSADDLDVEMKREQVRALRLQNDDAQIGVEQKRLRIDEEKLQLRGREMWMAGMEEFKGLSSSQLSYLVREAKAREDELEKKLRPSIEIDSADRPD